MDFWDPLSPLLSTGATGTHGHAWFLCGCLRVQTQVLKFALKCSYSLSHLPPPLVFLRQVLCLASDKTGTFLSLPLCTGIRSTSHPAQDFVLFCWHGCLGLNSGPHASMRSTLVTEPSFRRLYLCCTEDTDYKVESQGLSPSSICIFPRWLVTLNPM